MLRLRVLLYTVFYFWAFAFTALSCSATDSILFARLAPPQAELFISNADGSMEQALTPPDSVDYNPSWSSKGDWIVFTSERAGPVDLFRVHPDGTGLERLTDNAAFNDQAAFSPDGGKIVFVTTRTAGFANLWVLDLATHSAASLTTGSGGDFRPAWSPDGKWIAFSSDRGSSLPLVKGRWERLQLVDIYLIHPDGSGLRRISDHGNFCGGPKWTSDSKNVIAYCMSAEETWKYRADVPQGDTRLVKINIATGKAMPMPADTGVKIFPSVLPSGEIAYVRRDKPQGVFYTNGKSGPTGSDLYSPSWSPDGSHVVYSRYKPLRGITALKRWSPNPNYQLFTTAMLPSYDPTGRSFAVTVPTSDQTMAMFLVEDGKPHPIFEPKSLVLGPQWSPDGKQIVFGVGSFTSFLDFAAGTEKPLDPIDGGAQVGMINRDGSGFHLITSGPNNNAFASFAPDGKRIVYRTKGPNGEGLRIMNLADGSITVLTNEYDNFPAWSPRGDSIAFVRKVADDFEVLTIRPDGKDVNQLTHTHGNDAHVSWSPDGERLAFSSSRMGFKDEALNTNAPQPNGDIFVMRYDGTQVEQLTDNQWEEGGATWQPHNQN
jgi:Tol biopolymer transport system component